jgi:hypothetical protein
MKIPDYWLQQPTFDINNITKQSFDSIIKGMIKGGKNEIIQYSLPVPKWKFLCYLSEKYSYVLHGSGNSFITLFEPRQSNDIHLFGNQKAIYATTDGIWPIFYAICDRIRYSITINNACMYLIERDGKYKGPFYYFSISKNVLQDKPWRTGTVYILPKQTFIAQPVILSDENKIYVPQMASTVAVEPLARLTIIPEDFPFINEIRGHDDKDLEKISLALQKGDPLPSES